MTLKSYIKNCVKNMIKKVKMRGQVKKAIIFIFIIASPNVKPFYFSQRNRDKKNETKLENIHTCAYIGMHANILYSI